MAITKILARKGRLDVGIRYSRTGLTWMSFLVQARVTYHRARRKIKEAMP